MGRASHAPNKWVRFGIYWSQSFLSIRCMAHLQVPVKAAVWQRWLLLQPLDFMSPPSLSCDSLTKLTGFQYALSSIFEDSSRAALFHRLVYSVNPTIPQSCFTLPHRV
ncbi:hypothetical protein GDO81_018438 [Engystomops pustulosus]|uniref:Uncharacterized protein n=1 Tax=Engystomops pustulosus TaxID=76066 RepID=A0AAV6ZUQ2_ENGPU|nr:hypothetical protein GDO81_018438 [Engystomops pustulosus]